MFCELERRKLMKLLYVWIENFRNLIIKQEFLLGGPYRISFNQENEKIYINDNKNYVENFYSLYSESSPIKELTAIVGKNGSGKSTLVEFFRYANADIYNQENQKFVEVFIDEDEKLYYYHNKMPEVSFDKEITELKKKERFNLSKVLFLSTVLDRKKYLPLPRENNYSTNFLLENTGEFESEKIKQNLMFLLRRDEILRSRNIQEDRLDEIINEIPLPSTLRVSLVYKNDNQTTFIDKMIYSMISHYIHKRMILEAINQQEVVLLKQYIEVLEKGKTGRETINAIKSMKFVGGTFYRRENHVTVLDRINRFARYIELAIEEGRIRLLSDEQLEINDSYIMNQFIKKLSTYTKNQFSGLSLYWRELSTGEEMILDIFSRIMEGINKNKKQPPLQLIIIDEIENALHPQWQKQIISMFISFLEFYYPSLKFQIILTSHSPFLISDIPSDRILFLNYDKQYKVRTQKNLDEMLLTFGANINHLYSHAFFLKDGLMGKFAKNKINHLIDELLTNTPEYISINSERIRKQIHLIGEPIIKKKLINIYEEQIKLLKPSQFQIQEQIELLLRRVKYLEQKIEQDEIE